ncbi:tRNA-specific 2-thiouridylase [Dipodascopsis uninucleata]
MALGDTIFRLSFCEGTSVLLRQTCRDRVGVCLQRCRNGMAFAAGFSQLKTQSRAFSAKKKSKMANRNILKTDIVYVAMSGGVDSSVAAMLARERSANIIGIYMSNWSMPVTAPEDIETRYPSWALRRPEKLEQYLKEKAERDRSALKAAANCCETDWNDVQKVAEQLNIPVIRLSFEKDYWLEVFEPMISEYSNGHTPNPDVNCNRYIKFGKLYDTVRQMAHATDVQRWWLITGHYAKIVLDDDSRLRIARPVDRSKDQTFYLSTVPSERLEHVQFPLGDYTKDQVREMAKSMNLVTAHRPDSHGLCFVSPTTGAEAAAQAVQDGVPIPKPNRYSQFRDFLNEFIEPQPGNIVTTEGEVVGQHNGLWHATIGQRSGITLPQGNPKYKGVWYVVDKDQRKNELIIDRGKDSDFAYSTHIICGFLHWHGQKVSPEVLKQFIEKGTLKLQYRSLQEPINVTGVEVLTNLMSDNKTFYKFELEKPSYGVALGQFCVIYNNDLILCAGPIRDRVTLYNVSRNQELNDAVSTSQTDTVSP